MNKTIAGNDTIWKICIYVRLSKEEIRKNKTESDGAVLQYAIWLRPFFEKALLSSKESNAFLYLKHCFFAPNITSSE